MALFIVQEGANDVEWHVGGSAPISNAGDVVAVQVDGDELEFVLNHFSNLPTAWNCRVVCWYGDHAKFIARHIGRS